jgi:hypothetical protein
VAKHPPRKYPHHPGVSQTSLPYKTRDLRQGCAHIGVARRDQVDVNRVFTLENKARALIKSTRSAPLENIDPVRPGIRVHRHHMCQHLPTDPPSLKRGRDIKVLDPLAIRFGTHCNNTDVYAAFRDNKGPGRVERIDKSLPNTLGIKPAESFQVRTHHNGSQFSNPVHVRWQCGPQRPLIRRGHVRHNVFLHN